MRKILLSIALLLAASGTYAQSPVFTKYIMQSPSTRKDTRVQNDGSWFEGLKKYNADGSLAWSNSYSGADIISKLDVLDITDDGAGGAIVVGSVTGKVYNGTDTIRSGAAGYSNVFIARFSASGKMWQIMNTNNDVNYARDDRAFKVYKVGSDIYVGGIVASRDFSFGSYNFPRTLTDPSCRSFLAKIAMDGTLSWAKFTSGGNRVEAYQMTKDNADNFYLLGYVTGSSDITFGTGVTLTAHGMANYIAKFDKDGNAIFAKGIEEGANNAINAIAADNSENIYLSGFTGTALTIDGNNFRNNASFVMKLSNTGAYQWIRTLSPDIKNNSIPALFYMNGKIYFAGNTGTTATHLQTNATDSTLLVSNKLVIGSYTTDGVCDWHMQPTNTVSSSAINSVSYLHTTPDNQVLAIGGTFFNNDKFDTLNIPAPSVVPYNYGYITARVGGTSGTNNLHKSQLSAIIYPNPAHGHCAISLPSTVNNISVSVTDMSGKILFTATAANTATCKFELQHLSPGIYTVHISDGNLATTKLLRIE
jgi:hypothetical protein